MFMHVRLIEERERLGLNQDQMATAGGMKKRAYCYYESGERSPDASYLAAIASAGADVQYIVTGERRGEGLGESAVHQAVLDAVDLLSLEKKVDAQQLAKAVVKLCQKSAPAVQSGQMQTQNIQTNKGPLTQSGQIMIIKAPR
jgi:transcriptional regulator with XRE-family HTH domain